MLNWINGIISPRQQLVPINFSSYHCRKIWTMWQGSLVFLMTETTKLHTLLGMVFIPSWRVDYQVIHTVFHAINDPRVFYANVLQTLFYRTAYHTIKIIRQIVRNTAQSDWIFTCCKKNRPERERFRTVARKVQPRLILYIWRSE